MKNTYLNIIMVLFLLLIVGSLVFLDYFSNSDISSEVERDWFVNEEKNENDLNHSELKKIQGTELNSTNTKKNRVSLNTDAQQYNDASNLSSTLIDIGERLDADNTVTDENVALGSEAHEVGEFIDADSYKADEHITLNSEAHEVGEFIDADNSSISENDIYNNKERDVGEFIDVDNPSVSENTNYNNEVREVGEFIPLGDYE
ncbi:MAG: hypothetical protein OQL19_03150 [Gammaproteobacteria bacterium]|nr:hypothetical protein [Gammaproteobacteria bacterium]